jgi:hypothetical protein
LISSCSAETALRTLQTAPAGVDVDEATDGILSNLLVTRDTGTFARGSGTIHFTQRGDTLIPRNARFFKTSALVFFLDSSSDLLVPGASMRPISDATGRVQTWAYDVLLIAARTGSAYRVGKGRFFGYDPFSPYLAFVENTVDFAGGLDVETTANVIPRAASAISLRAMVNSRSNDARIREVFPEVLRVLSIGMGDPEMVRDQTNGLSPGAPTHRGGHVDVYVDLPVQTVTETLVIGAPSPRPDGRCLTLRDSSPPTGSFVSAGVRPGDVLVMAAGLPEAPLQYRVASVRALELDIVPPVPFSRATDEDTTPPALTYSVGNNYPSFDNHVNAGTRATARTTRQISVPGSVILPAHPVYRISRVEIFAPPSGLAPYADPSTGTVLFPVRRNTAWPRPPVVGEPLSYRVIGATPESSQSTQALNILEVAWPGLDLDGTQVSVTYDTPVGFDAIQDLLTSSHERLLNANYLARAPHPIYVSCTIPYRGRTLPTGLGVAAAAVNETLVVRAVRDLIEASLPGQLDANAITNAVLRADPNVGLMYAFDITYEMVLPDGRVARFSTRDLVETVPSAQSTAALVNPTDLGLPDNYMSPWLMLLRRFGVSDRVVRYLTDSSLITMERRA